MVDKDCELGPPATRATDRLRPAGRDRALRAGARVPRWSAGELATLGRITETLVAMGDPEATAIARASAARLALNLDRAQVNAIRAVLRLFEVPLLGLLLGGSPLPLSRMSPDGRERELRRWATSRFIWRRAAFQALKRVTCFRAYADPAPAGRPNALQQSTGYRPFAEAVTVTPTPDLAFRLPVVPRGSSIDVEADVVIVGSGAGGGTVSRELAAAGRSVVVLEAGPLVREPDMPLDETDAYDRLFLDGAMTATWDGSISIVAGSCVGGGTTVNWAAAVAPPDAVREEWVRTHGLDGFDGPEFEADLAALGPQIAFAPPPAIPAKDRLILDGAAALGLEVAPLTRSASGCGNCGSCAFGCRRGAKQSTLRVQLPDAWANGARIIPDAPVTRVHISAGRVRGVEAEVTSSDGPRLLRVRADQVVLAAGALRTPGILERSGVHHPALGRHLRLQPVSMLAAFQREPVEMWNGTTQAVRSFASAPGTSRAAAGHAGFTIESAPGHLGLLAVTFPWRSRAEFAALMERARFVSPVIAITRDAVGGRVRLTAGGRTRIDYDLNAAGMRTLRAGLLAAAEIARAGGATAMLAPGEPAAWWEDGAAGAASAPGPWSSSTASRDWPAFRRRVESIDLSSGRGVVLSAHQLGSARMGASAHDHPVDPRGRVRSGRAHPFDQVVRGLYVADSSLFPTGLGVNPMVTVMLLARRVARTVLAEGGTGGRGG